jgi:hypothetical protein
MTYTAYGLTALALALGGAALRARTITDVGPTASTFTAATTERPFDPDGYYLPQPRIVVGKYEIVEFELHTLNYYYGGQSHSDDPERVTDPQLLMLRLISDTTRGIPAALCAEQIISPDTLHLKCQSSYLGDIVIDGHFLDKRGDFGNLFSNDVHPQFVLRARVRVEQGDRVLYSKPHSFRYIRGD